MTKITKRSIENIQQGEILWDGEIKGFGCRCQKRTKTYVLKYRFNGRVKWYTIGKVNSPWTPVTARKEALRLLSIIHAGTDPSKAKAILNNQPTIKDLCDRFISDYANEHKKPSSIRMDKANINNHILPLLGKYYVADVTREDIDKFKRNVKDGKTARSYKDRQRGGSTVTGGKGIANRCLSLLSKMFNLAERWNMRADNSNPCRHVDKYPENKVERFLSNEEITTLEKTLKEAEANGSEGIYQVAAIRLLLLTGCRLGEILNLKWEYVDLTNKMLLLPDSKTGKKSVFLSDPAIKVLQNIPKTKANPYVICGNGEGKALVNLQKPWGRIRKIAKIEDVRIHDLRHSFASIAASSGLSLPIIGKLLGHTQAATTQRYAHLAAEPIRDANEIIGQKLSTMMNGTSL